MAVHYSDGGTSANNDGGVIRFGGNVASTRWSKSNLGDTKRQYAPQMYEGMSGVHKSNNSGNFARMVAGEYIIRRITTKCAGVTNDAMLSGGSNVTRHNIHAHQSSFNTTFLSGLQWAANRDGQPTYTLTKTTRTLTYNSDNEIASITNRGEFAMREGGPNPVAHDYDTKTQN